MTSLAAELERAGVRSLEQVRWVGSDGPLVAADPLEHGWAEADALVDGGADLVVVDARPGLAAVAATALLLELEPVAAVGTTATPDWAERVRTVRTLLGRARPHRFLLAGLLCALDDPDLARTTGLLDRLATRRTPVLLGDSTTVLAAALLAREERWDATDWWLVSAVPDDPAGRAAAASLGLPALLDLGLDGQASRYALGLLREAVAGA